MLKEITQKWFDENKMAPNFQLSELNRQVGVENIYDNGDGTVTFGSQLSDNEIAVDLEYKTLKIGTWEDITTTYVSKRIPKDKKVINTEKSDIVIDNPEFVETPKKGKWS